MTRIVIIKADNVVGMDDRFYSVDCSKLPSNFHALEFFTDTNTGEVQWTGKPRPQNTLINSIQEYQSYLLEWQKKNIEHQILEEQMAAKRAASSDAD